eukprot:jgi/Tetstr1/433698/TSEL_022917.t1
MDAAPDVRPQPVAKRAAPETEPDESVGETSAPAPVPGEVLHCPWGDLHEDVGAVGNIEAGHHRMGPEIRSLRLSASLSMSPSLKVCKEVWIFIHKVSSLRPRKVAQSRLPTDCTDWPTKLMRFPIEFFPLTTKSACFMVGNVAQTVTHFGFSETAANKIASALDMAPNVVFSHTAASGVRKLWVRAFPDPVTEHAYADRKRALQDSNGSQGAWPEAYWQHAVESVLFVEC